MTRSSSFQSGSFRDRDARVFLLGNEVFRALSPTALENWRHLEQKNFFSKLTREGTLVATTEVVLADGSTGDLPGEWAGFLKHEPILFVTYPYEWCFGMLHDAAILQLGLLRDALDEKMILKDATPFNIQWRGSRPQFIDIASFEQWNPGEPWAGYRQFCKAFLYPIMLQAFKDFDFQRILRSHLDGIEPVDFNRLLSVSDRLRPGVFTHVYLHAHFQRRFDASKRDLRSDFRDAGFDERLIRRNIDSLLGVLEKCRWQRTDSQWVDYEDLGHYAEDDRSTKERFVEDAAAAVRPSLAWDLGANVGRFSRIVSRHAEYVVAMDSDHLVIERLYRALRSEQNERILPLVMNLADPSPACGWAGRERSGLLERGRPDLVICLALLHHLVLRHNVPLEDVVRWLAELGCCCVVEFVTKEDTQVKSLLLNRKDIFSDYDFRVFEALLRRHFRIERRESLAEGRRLLYFAVPVETRSARSPDASRPS